MKEELLKKAYINAFSIEDKYIKNMIILNTKSLIDDLAQRYVKIDKNRLRDELLYYRFYGEKLSDINIVNILLPVIISNTNMKKSEEEVVKVIKYYVLYNKKNEYMNDFLISSLIYNTLIHSIIENKDIEYEELMQKIKSTIIEFTYEMEKTEVIKFEMKRIQVIQSIDRYIDLKIKDYEDNDIINNLLNVIHDIYISDRDTKIQGIKSIKKSILSILGFDINEKIDNIDFINSMAEYIIKLRKYKINKKEYNIKSDPRYLINLEIGDTKSDPILNNIKVISRNFSNNVLNIGLVSKTGDYNFKFKRA
ncbi:hypothetical protein [Paraclostridium bifermentans]|jgi:hypothetical protein|uniref:Uncharacterized protein n=2 Tax=Paraclostridium TaxID=1849822 RepID=T4VM01_PARBF|nr:hypothetical protein [Paraclostridium bifermentans]EQK44739.1 hypothetical protein C672_0403 [[Clostridium] bifermentans ATCC 638] [Paraclostridium bifermentans ATCC 638 = DSM 14991]MBS5954274.1 hypothetical protein [Paraclostridium bifermentans]MBU5289107.1 hypothetical protein [Paraclostridium bifermentans]RIZ58266.1 hypothetical protein CHH45_11820 [Paraclostridium bifermentans]UAG17865.1 hypothetical protein KXZ80_13985 [Paraclostridium bifermentans]